MAKDTGTKQVKMLNIVNNILNFNEQNRQGNGLKLLTPNQMLSRLPISLGQLNPGNNSKKLKNEKDNYCILCTDQKHLQNTSIKAWLTLFKDGNNFYEHRK